MAPPKQANGAAEAEESPVVVVLQKRLRNLRKRLRNADEIQEKQAAGKTLQPEQARPRNMPCACRPPGLPWVLVAGHRAAHTHPPAADERPGVHVGLHNELPRLMGAVPTPLALQEHALNSRPGLLAAIEELEKMTAGLKEALKEELTTAAADARAKALAEAEAGEPAIGLGRVRRRSPLPPPAACWSTAPCAADQRASCSDPACTFAALAPTCTWNGLHLTLAASLLPMHAAAAAKERASLKSEAAWEAEREAAVAAARKESEAAAAAAQQKAVAAAVAAALAKAAGEAEAARAAAVEAARAEASKAASEEAVGTLMDVMYLGNVRSGGVWVLGWAGLGGVRAGAGWTLAGCAGGGLLPGPACWPPCATGAGRQQRARPLCCTRAS